MNDTQQTIKTYILETFLPGEDAAALSTTTPLRSTGILDSLATLDLVSFLEERFQIELGAQDVDPSRWENIEELSALVERKRNGR